MKIRTTILCLIALISTASAEPELKGTYVELTEYLKDVPQTITLTGESEVKVQADKAIISLRVRTENKSLQEALRQNQALRGRIVELLSQRGIPNDRVQTTKFSSTPNQGIFSDKAKSYTVENSVKVSVENEKEFQTVAAIVDGSPEVHHEGVEFQHSNKEALKVKALQQAGEQLAARKKLFEGMLDVSLKPKRFAHATGTPEAVREARKRYVSMEGGAAPSYGRKAVGVTHIPGGAPSGGEDTELVSSFGELIFSAHLTVDYALEPK